VIYSSWGKSYPELVVHCPVYASRQQTPGDVFALHPLHPRTLVLIEAILTQIADIFPSPYLHTGGDEVMTECWLEDPVLVRETCCLSLLFLTCLPTLSAVKGDQLQRCHSESGTMSSPLFLSFPSLPPLTPCHHRYSVNSNQRSLKLFGSWERFQ
jgi:hypothetical protein